ncbi:ribose-phosphate pyrophosphokinase [Ornithobacterium rhinotracheale]|uniref:ribose-phosphate diphosphokinase n=1 Tax=Ornithobacterium rhinotracheale (strain ATCC 51463 / DSM 15997 / CCUG 23171 / CIP 104009 / LMG 9086) TaxID=867902 RepID=I4A0N6_ORNRL|nr:ribose-phosphate pyrophosphokinase [Ornithobacterium rhinotracheale]AFL97520.1 ribose-phosphate pyrophosphokinase [Ornithobacterium rhinotracheale DSM 15997]AIP98947.1 ribose-phosphate pyrophosphokinase [Ornithobacterium rhinotracheale ORT-UMN 88]KGB66886.1 ribose-phosphate pyrophosphokinase [Ornithobacterium rhinotracheale H06-030791]MCK0195112.1 ribose-phosphate pyrophosphokinase [Ornithobacterium rhinotracheale]MCK0203283.1 ribose-phosphate pyrophosphokinase [Ornithobacterium rhinotrache
MDQPALLFSTRQSRVLAEKIAQHYGQELGNVKFLEFSDGEYQPCFEQSIRGARVFIIGSTFMPDSNLMEILLMCDAAKRASAKSITVVIPYFGYARQDRKDKPRVPIGAKLVANLLSAAGATRVMTMDLHADQIQGFFEIPVDHIYASTILVDYVRNLNLENLTIASPDMGGAKRANAYASYLKSDIVICYKERKKANVVENMMLIGDVKDKDVIIVDDMIDTAGTITKAAALMIEKGARSVRAMATHAVLSGKAYERIQDSVLEEVVVTDTIPLKRHDVSKIKVVSCASLFADVMHLVHNRQSISRKFVI